MGAVREPCQRSEAEVNVRSVCHNQRTAPGGRSARTATSAAARGFTLVELIIVIAVLSIVSALAIPRFAAGAMRRRIDAAAQRVVQDLKLARQYARQTSTAQSVTFETSSDSYRFDGMADPDHPDSRYTVRLGEQPYEVDLYQVSLGGDDVFEFDGFGNPDSDGTITLQVGDLARTITIDRVTGVISVSDLAAAVAEPESLPT